MASKVKSVPALSLLCAVLWAVMLVSCAPSPGPEDVKAVSLVQLIAAADSYHDHWVTASGVLGLDFEGTVLFLSIADHNHQVVMNSIWLDLEPEQADEVRDLAGRYVVLEGRFDADYRGHFDLLSGSIRDISSIRLLPGEASDPPTPAPTPTPTPLIDSGTSP